MAELERFSVKTSNQQAGAARFLLTGFFKGVYKGIYSRVL